MTLRTGVWTLIAVAWMTGCIDVTRQQGVPTGETDDAEDTATARVAEEDETVDDGTEEVAGGAEDVAEAPEDTWVPPADVPEDVGPGTPDVAPEVETTPDVEEDVPELEEVDAGPPPSLCDDLDCDDDEPCTDDDCDPVLGCVYSNNLEPCEDGNPCTVLDGCDFGDCQPGLPSLWDLTFGGPTDDVARGVDVLDGGDIVAVGTVSGGVNGLDAFVMRIDMAGQIVWKKHFDGVDHQLAEDVVAAADGLYVVGQTSVDGQGRLWTRKYGLDGSTKWDYVHAVASGGTGVALHPDGGAVVVGSAFGSTLALHVDEGDDQWDVVSSGVGEQGATDVAAVDGGFIVSGTKAEDTGSQTDGFFLSVGVDGSTSWLETVGEKDVVESLQSVAPNGSGAVGVGSTNIEEGTGSLKLDGWFVAVDGSGNVTANEVLNPLSFAWSELHGVCRLADGNFGIGGLWGNSSGHNDPAWMGKVTADGKKVWYEPGIIAVTNLTLDKAWACAGAADGSVVFAGDRTQEGVADALVNDPFVTRRSPDGKTVCQ